MRSLWLSSLPESRDLHVLCVAAVILDYYFVFIGFAGLTYADVPGPADTVVFEGGKYLFRGGLNSDHSFKLEGVFQYLYLSSISWSLIFILKLIDVLPELMNQGGTEK